MQYRAIRALSLAGRVWSWAIGGLVLSLSMAGCGGGSNAAGSTTDSGNGANMFVLSLSQTGNGSINSNPVGLSCTATCNSAFPSNSVVTLNATPANGYVFGGWGGACTGVASCTVTMSQAQTVTATFTVLSPPANGAPVLLYTDVVSGPTSGGENNLGGYLSIFGKNFGMPSGLGTITRVYIGGREVANYRYLGPSKVFSQLGIQQIAVQVGPLGGASQGAALPVSVVVNGLSSNANDDLGRPITFTPNPGRILFVSLNGNDSTAAVNDINHPWRNLQTPTRGGAYATMGAGDQVIIRGGNWSDLGFDGSWLRFRDPSAQGTSPTGASGSGWIHITAYPGPINGNAIEDVHYSTPAGNKGGIQGPNSVYFGTTGDYVSISNLRIDVDANATSDAAPFNEQYGQGPWRVVNNEAGPWPSTLPAPGNSKGGGFSGHGDGTEVLGNHIHDMACTGALENHGIYIDSGGRNDEIAYNWIHDITGGNLVQFYDNVGLAGNSIANMPANWPGFTNMSVHHNWLERSGKYGLNMADGIVSGNIWNNVVIGASGAGLRFNTISQNMNMTVAFNTFYDNTRGGGDNNPQIANTWGNYGPTGTIRIYDNIISAGPHSSNGSNSQYYANLGNSDSYLDFKRNLYWDYGLGWASNSKDPTGIYGNPLFNAPASSDLSLTSNSPAIDAGTQAIGFSVSNDLTFTTPRPKGAANDLGAYEH